MKHGTRTADLAAAAAGIAGPALIFIGYSLADDLDEDPSMGMRLFFVLVTVGGSAYLLYTERGDRKVAIGALAASSFGFLLQTNMISLHVRSARMVVWAAIAVCAGLLWMRDGNKITSTVAASMVFVSTLILALSLRILH